MGSKTLKYRGRGRLHKHVGSDTCTRTLNNVDYFSTPTTTGLFWPIWQAVFFSIVPSVIGTNGTNKTVCAGKLNTFKTKCHAVYNFCHWESFQQSSESHLYWMHCTNIGKLIGTVKQYICNSPFTFRMLTLMFKGKPAATTHPTTLSCFWFKALLSIYFGSR